MPNIEVVKNRFFPLTYHSTNKTKSRGVFILLSSKLPWTLRGSMIDGEGRFAFIKGLISAVQLTLAIIYAPNEHQDTFIHRTLAKKAN